MTKRAALRAAGLALTGLITLVSRPRASRACAIAPPPGENVHTTREEAIIVWDAAHHLEHFVRSAAFDSSAKSFGFLVPTPSRPMLAEASDTAADALALLTAPDTVDKPHFYPVPFGITLLPFLFFARSRAIPPVAASAVTVLEETRVAGLDATILEASDPTALGDWLHAHDFAFGNALERWVAPYLAKHWNVTAFRYVRPDVAANTGMAADAITSRTVRLTFETDVPIYPYREPDDVAAVPNRELHLFVVSNEKLDASFDDGSGAWPALAPFSARVAPSFALTTALPGVELPKRPWVTELSDRASLRHPSDVVFRPAASPAEIRPPPRIVFDDTPIPIPYELPFVVGGVWWWRRRRRTGNRTL